MCHKKTHQSSVSARMMYNTIFYIPTKQRFKCFVWQLQIYFSSFVFEDGLMWFNCVPPHKNTIKRWQWMFNFDKSPKQMLLPHCRRAQTNCFAVLKSHHAIRPKWKKKQRICRNDLTSSNPESNKQTRADLLQRHCSWDNGARFSTIKGQWVRKEL